MIFGMVVVSFLFLPSCVLKGRMDLKHGVDGTETLTVREGETCLVERGERFRPMFPEGGTVYIPVCVPAFKPERCKREEDGVSDVSKKLHELHGGGGTSSSSDRGNANKRGTIVSDDDKLYHMCEKKLWEEAVASGSAYYPPTFEKDGYFTHATSVPSRLVDTANHFYTDSKGDWICLDIDAGELRKSGIITRYEEPKSVGDTEVAGDWDTWACPHIFGGIPTADKVVKKTYPMTRDEKGNFLTIETLLG